MQIKPILHRYAHYQSVRSVRTTNIGKEIHLETSSQSQSFFSLQLQKLRPKRMPKPGAFAIRETNKHFMVRVPKQRRRLLGTKLGAIRLKPVSWVNPNMYIHQTPAVYTMQAWHKQFSMDIENEQRVFHGTAKSQTRPRASDWYLNLAGRLPGGVWSLWSMKGTWDPIYSLK